MIELLLLAIGVVVAAGLSAAALGRLPRLATAVGAGGCVLGCLAGCVPAFRAAIGAATGSVDLPWHVPYGSFHVGLDSLSGFFLVPVLGLSALAAVFGAGYMLHWRGKRSLGPPWLFFNLLVASMALVLVARNAVLFLVAWETMSLASFFLVTFEDEKEAVRRAGWTYLVATHLSAAFLLLFFLILGRERGTLDLGSAAGAGALASPTAALLFLLALVGFGTKAGFLPLHVWLPEAHPAAPSHVSAVMSGVMIKLGIYGIARSLTLLGPPPAWWGWTLVGIGAVSGVVGVLFALAQHDLKRLLAYHSVENIGIIALGLGLGVLGVAAGSDVLAVLGFGGSLLHVLNHAIFKGLLFLCAGSAAHSTGTREMDHLGGLLRRMPWTGTCFLVGAAAISGLPPLNGFVSEFLIYLGAFGATAGGEAPATSIPAIAAIVSLALIGGLALACFAKAFGVVFLGSPRSEAAEGARESGPLLVAPLVVLATACAGVAFLAPVVAGCLAPAIGALAGQDPEVARGHMGPALGALRMVALSSGAVAGLVVAVAGLRRSLLRDRPVNRAVTWDCGYSRPAARMQYTSSSFAQPLVDLFRIVLRTKRRASPPEGWFPAGASLSTESEDACREHLYAPLFRGVRRLLGGLRWLQHGRVQLYVLYIAIALLILLFWKLR